MTATPSKRWLWTAGSTIFFALILATLNYYRDDIPSAVVFSVFANVFTNETSLTKLGSGTARLIFNLTGSVVGSSTTSKNRYVQNQSIIILAWSVMHSGNSWESMQPPLFRNCPSDLNCVITSNRKFFNQSSAVIFHMTTPYWWDPTPFRRSDQYFIFALWEAPTHQSSGFNSPKDFFNLTMTYRRDSDIFWPYGSLRKRSTVYNRSESAQIENTIKGKTKLVAWMASNCPTPGGRDKYIRELKKHIPVDIFGACGTLTCPRDPGQSHTALGTKHWKPCESMLGKVYKFYLAFENSVCKDYATEKFFQRMDNAYLVPVVLERTIILDAAYDESMRKILNSTFIAADDFDDPKGLADYLLYLDKNVTAYTQYFEWRRDYEVWLESQLKPGCELCRVVTEAKTENRKRVIGDIKEWWIRKANCHEFKLKNGSMLPIG